MRISDWSSDVCSSDLLAPLVRLRDEQTETLLGYETIVDLSVQREDEAERVIREAEEAQRQRSTAEQLKADAENRRDKIERSEEHTSELQSLMRISYAVFCLKKKKPCI